MEAGGIREPDPEELREWQAEFEAAARRPLAIDKGTPEPVTPEGVGCGRGPSPDGKPIYLFEGIR